MSELSIDWLKGRLLPSQLPRIVLNAFVHRRESQAVFSQFRYPKRGGFFSFFDPLYEGIDISFGHRAQQIDAKAKKIVFENGRTIDYEACASSLPLPALIGMIKNCPLAIREAAKKLAFTKLLCVNIVLSRPNMTDKHWFYVYDSDIDICRVSVPTNLCRNERSQQVTGLQAEIFRSGTESMAVAPLVEKAVLDMSRMMGFDAKK
ncbi:MAG: protoporphyrinogen oxidase, partial [Candidatus Marinamargulisbacteria bacterium]